MDSGPARSNVAWVRPAVPHRLLCGGSAARGHVVWRANGRAAALPRAWSFRLGGLLFALATGVEAGSTRSGSGRFGPAPQESQVSASLAGHTLRGREQPYLFRFPVYGEGEHGTSALSLLARQSMYHVRRQADLSHRLTITSRYMNDQTGCQAASTGLATPDVDVADDVAGKFYRVLLRMGTAHRRFTQDVHLSARESHNEPPCDSPRSTSPKLSLSVSGT